MVEFKGKTPELLLLVATRKSLLRLEWMKIVDISFIKERSEVTIQAIVDDVVTLELKL